ncbi:MAG: hypothetical protein IT176_07595 [Acidobacteria bacterium]|nr:hypothetical protein [Acidobacteriota bacterium]
MLPAEPFTALTDYALAAAALGFAVAAARSRGAHNRVSAWLWCAAFVAAAVAAAVGGTYHGLHGRLDARRLDALWNITVFAMGGCAAFIVAGIHTADLTRGGDTIGWLIAAIATTLAGAAVQQLGVPGLAGWNRNAMYHLIQIAGLYLFHRSARTVRDRPGAPAC